MPRAADLTLDLSVGAIRNRYEARAGVIRRAHLLGGHRTHRLPTRLQPLGGDPLERPILPARAEIAGAPGQEQEADQDRDREPPRPHGSVACVRCARATPCFDERLQLPRQHRPTDCGNHAEREPCGDAVSATDIARAPDEQNEESRVDEQRHGESPFEGAPIAEPSRTDRKERDKGKDQQLIPKRRERSPQHTTEGFEEPCERALGPIDPRTIRAIEPSGSGSVSGSTRAARRPGDREPAPRPTVLRGRAARWTSSATSELLPTAYLREAKRDHEQRPHSEEHRRAAQEPSAILSGSPRTLRRTHEGDDPESQALGPRPERQPDEQTECHRAATIRPLQQIHGATRSLRGGGPHRGRRSSHRKRSRPRRGGARRPTRRSTRPHDRSEPRPSRRSRRRRAVPRRSRCRPLRSQPGEKQLEQGDQRRVERMLRMGEHVGKAPCPQRVRQREKDRTVVEEDGRPAPGDRAHRRGEDEQGPERPQIGSRRHLPPGRDVHVRLQHASRASSSTARRRSVRKSGIADTTRFQLGICGDPIGSRTKSRPAARRAPEKVSTATSSS